MKLTGGHAVCSSMKDVLTKHILDHIAVMTPREMLYELIKGKNLTFSSGGSEKSVE